MIKQTLECPEDELASLLTALVPLDAPYTYTRTDLHNYIPLLDKFDAILERIIEEYKIDFGQGKAFTDTDEELILEILRVERLILDNSTSRRIFASYDVRSAFALKT